MVFLKEEHIRCMQKTQKNVLLAGLLCSFVGGVYFWTTKRVKGFDVFSPVANELDEVRKLKNEADKSKKG